MLHANGTKDPLYRLFKVHCFLTTEMGGKCFAFALSTRIHIGVHRNVGVFESTDVSFQLWLCSTLTHIRQVSRHETHEWIAGVGDGGAFSDEFHLLLPIYFTCKRAIFRPHCLSRICGFSTKLHCICSMSINSCVYVNTLLERTARAGMERQGEQKVQKNTYIHNTYVCIRWTGKRADNVEWLFHLFHTYSFRFCIANKN